MLLGKTFDLPRACEDFPKIAIVTTDQWVIWSAWLSHFLWNPIADSRIFQCAYVANEGMCNDVSNSYFTDELAPHLGESNWRFVIAA